ncbi:hypothetical protein PIROE2DRAFT_11925 [Piromyces sp. E2]|nr:hypothetical protein PIROE2DRAFT_11925 [Piromyces sp. E2]|eukprot:OUM61913.1 hypothetical protein PIROE2DRAFT_11925 [Piromyces sp. E2]
MNVISYISLYALSRDLKIPPLAGICATQQIKCFIKRRNSNGIIRDLVRDIPTMSHYSWIKESKSFQKPYLNLGIIWNIRIGCGFENTTRIVITSNRVTPDFLSYCPCCGSNKLSYIGFYCGTKIFE